MKMLVALDGSPRAAGVLRAAVELARKVGAEVTLLRVVFVPAEFPPAAHVKSGDALPAHMMEDAERELRALVAAEEGVRFGAPLARRGGQPWRTIVDVGAELDADLVVVGSHGYHGVDRLLGTTAAKVTNHAERNVLVVYEKGKG